MRVLRPDEELVNADWTKGTWDLPDVDSPEALRAFLQRMGMTFAQFKRLPVYQRNRDRIPWLAGMTE